MGAQIYRDTGDASNAAIRVGRPAAGEEPIGPYLTGKFCEHLGANIYRGMHAQVLQNPTFGDWPFADGMRPDGGIARTADEARIAARIEARATQEGWPEPARLVEARRDGLAYGWIREGARDRVRVSPDAGPHGGRAQRVEMAAAGEGIAQWIRLPLHRVRAFEWTVAVRSPDLARLRLALHGEGAAKVTLLAAERPWDRNSVDQPDRIAPVTSAARIEKGVLAFVLPPYALAVVEAP
jgi:alpha-N-arabinofuranosidase